MGSKRHRNPEKRARKRAAAGGIVQEQRFKAIVQLASRVRVEYDKRLIPITGMADLERTQLPDYLFTELGYLADAEYTTAITLLLAPRLSFSAELHLRPLLEFVAYVSFVLGKETDHPVGTIEQRATCLALTRSREGCDLMSLACAEGMVSVEQVLGAYERVRAYEDLHERIGCPYINDRAAWPCENEKCLPCRHLFNWPCHHPKMPQARKLTKATLYELVRRLNQHWLVDLYQTSSMRIHLGLIDRIVTSVDGRDILGKARFDLRAGFLQSAIQLYALGLGWTLEFYSRDASRSLSQWLQLVYAHPDLREAMNGTFDAT